MCLPFRLPGQRRYCLVGWYYIFFGFGLRTHTHTHRCILRSFVAMFQYALPSSGVRALHCAPHSTCAHLREHVCPDCLQQPRHPSPHCIERTHTHTHHAGPRIFFIYIFMLFLHKRARQTHSAVRVWCVAGPAARSSICDGMPTLVHIHTHVRTHVATYRDSTR